MQLCIFDVAVDDLVFVLFRAVEEEGCFFRVGEVLRRDIGKLLRIALSEIPTVGAGENRTL